MVRFVLLAGLSLVGLAADLSGAETLPVDASQVVSDHEAKADQIRKEAEKEVDARKAELLSQLEELQARYAKEGKLNEAVAIRNQIRRLRTPALSFSPGTKVEVEWSQRWWPAEVVASRVGAWQIKYDGYGPEWNEWVPAARIRPRGANPGM